jgi:hypothetical protein
MDHETALQAANQALSGNALSGTSHFASVELRGVAELGRSGGRSARPREDTGPLPSGAWELAAMNSVGVATLLLVLGLWFL